MGAVWIRPWAGGRVREVDGREVWVIERRIGGGNRRVVTLDVHSERDAMAELALFERDPLGYRTRREAVAADPGAVAMDDETLAGFAEYCRKQGLSDTYRKHILGRYLGDWAAALGRRDLRRVELTELIAHLDRWKTARHHRIVAIKAFTAWLRETAKLHRKNDPTLDLKVPTSVAEKSVRPKGYTLQRVEQVYAKLKSQVARDIICLRAKTGMHDTEIARVARGAAVLRRIDDPSGIAGTITFAHLKAGKTHVVSVDAQTFAAAERLATRGRPMARHNLRMALDRVAIDEHGCGGVKVHNYSVIACKKGCQPLHPGELRHSFATWARGQGKMIRPKEGGVPLKEVAAVMGHYSERTTKVFYEGNEVPPMIALPLRLEHPADPPVTGTGSSPRRHGRRGGSDAA